MSQSQFKLILKWQNLWETVALIHLDYTVNLSTAPSGIFLPAPAVCSVTVELKFQRSDVEALSERLMGYMLHYSERPSPVLSQTAQPSVS